MPLQPGDWIGSRGRATWRDPWNYPLYAGMQEYAKRRYPWRCAETGMTHARLVLPNGLFFEQTVPVARILPLNDPKTDLAGKFKEGRLRIARWLPPNAPNWPELAHNAALMNGRPYDYGDMADFALTGLVGAWAWLLRKGPIRIFGDKAKRYVVCSVADADLLRMAGVRFPIAIAGIDPNWPWNAGWEGCPTELCPYGITDQITAEDFK